MKVAILQSNYIPWKGYFDLINSVDEFIIYDEMQYTKNDWRNRNKIKTQAGLKWLTIPVRQYSLGQRIDETLIADSSWNAKHWMTIRQFYSKAKWFGLYKEIFEELFLSTTSSNLSEVNIKFIRSVCEILNIKTKISSSQSYRYQGDRNERLVSLVKAAGATKYLSGPAAKDYLDIALFEKENVEVQWMDYSGYLEYDQLFPPFEHGVSILDLVFNTGPDYKKYMKSFSENKILV